MFAADAGDEEVCDLLLHAGADPSEPCQMWLFCRSFFLFPLTTWRLLTGSECKQNTLDNSQVAKRL